MTWMLHVLGGTRSAAPVREARSTLAEQSARTAGFACTMFTSKGAESLGIMAIANVCQVCACPHGMERAVMTPLISFPPAQHSGVFTHAALAPATDAAGQCSVVVATPNTPTAPGRDAAGELSPAGPLPAEPPPGESRRGTTSSAAAATAAAPPAAASTRGARRLATLAVVSCAPAIAAVLGPPTESASDSAGYSVRGPPTESASDSPGRDGALLPAGDTCERDIVTAVEGVLGPCHSRDGARPRPPPSSAASSSRSEAADGSRRDGSAARHARRMSIIPAGTPGMSSTCWPRRSRSAHIPGDSPLAGKWGGCPAVSAYSVAAIE